MAELDVVVVVVVVLSRGQARYSAISANQSLWNPVLWQLTCGRGEVARGGLVAAAQDWLPETPVGWQGHGRRQGSAQGCGSGRSTAEISLGEVDHLGFPGRFMREAQGRGNAHMRNDSRHVAQEEVEEEE